MLEFDRTYIYIHVCVCMVRCVRGYCLMHTATRTPGGVALKMVSWHQGSVHRPLPATSYATPLRVKWVLSVLVPGSSARLRPRLLDPAGVAWVTSTRRWHTAARHWYQGRRTPARQLASTCSFWRHALRTRHHVCILEARSSHAVFPLSIVWWWRQQWWRDGIQAN